MPWKIIEPYSAYIIIAAAVLVVLLVLIFLIRLMGRTVAGRRSGNRLEVVDYHDIDKTRRLLIIRRDNVEHLVMIGGPQDVVIEEAFGPGGVPSLARRSQQRAAVDDTVAAGEPVETVRPTQMAPRKAAAAPGPNIRQFTSRNEPALGGARPVDPGDR